MADSGERGCEIGKRMVQRHQSVRGDRSRKGGLQSAGESLAQGERSQFSAKGRRVNAAQVPARTHRGPALASSHRENTLKECKRANRRKADQDVRPHGFPGKLPKNAALTQITPPSAGKDLGQGKRSQLSAKGRRVGVAQVPARRHNVPTSASSPLPNTPK